MEYEEACDWLYEKLPIYQRTGKLAYKPDLGNIRELSRAFGDPHERFPSIHIAGTNGKGSTAHILSSILQEAGYRTGLHTQPHFFELRERIRVNGEACPQAFIAEKVEAYRKMDLELAPSFFELLVAFAFLHFREEEVDIAIIETGLGGRLDATNIITPELSIITNIGHDHMELLGPDLPSIAKEKAGIIKEGVPVVTGEIPEEAMQVIRDRASEMKAPIRQVKELGGLKLSDVLQGPHQKKNVRTALAAIEALREKGREIPEEAVRRGTERIVLNTGFMGRWQLLEEKPLVIADMGHNREAIMGLRKELERREKGRILLVFGTVEGKELDRILEELPAHSEFFPCEADIPRAMSIDVLDERIREKGYPSKPFKKVENAFEAARSEAGPEDLILVTGSAFVVGEFLEKRAESVGEN